MDVRYERNPLYLYLYLYLSFAFSPIQDHFLTDLPGHIKTTVSVTTWLHCSSTYSVQVLRTDRKSRKSPVERRNTIFTDATLRVIARYTPPKFNSEFTPEKVSSQKKSILPSIGSFLVFGGILLQIECLQVSCYFNLNCFQFLQDTFIKFICAMV